MRYLVKNNFRNEYLVTPGGADSSIFCVKGCEALTCRRVPAFCGINYDAGYVLMALCAVNSNHSW